MKLITKIGHLFKFVVNSDYRFMILSNKGFYKKMDDAEYLKRKYKVWFGRTLNLDNPKSYNEKVQWLKLYDRRPIYPQMVDKYEAKKLVASIIGDEYIIPTLGVWDKFDDIDFDSLPEKFVLKCTHDSAGLVICKDKSSLDIRKAKKKLESALKRNFYYLSREWPYSQVKPRIIAEKYMEDEFGELRDYKIYCFNGKMKLIKIICGRFSSAGARGVYYDRDFRRIDMAWAHKPNEETPSKPSRYEDMIELAEKLSAGLPHVRVDFYLVDNKIYFGELTLYDGGGFDVIEPYEKDLEIGEFLELPEKIE